MAGYMEVLDAAARYGDRHFEGGYSIGFLSNMNSELLQLCLPPRFDLMCDAAHDLPAGDHFDRMRAAEQAIVAEKDKLLSF